MPITPKSEPQIESDSRMMAGLSPVALPMMRGTRNPSCITCTVRYTARVHTASSQKLLPVSAAPMTQSRAAGM